MNAIELDQANRRNYLDPVDPIQASLLALHYRPVLALRLPGRAYLRANHREIKDSQISPAIGYHLPEHFRISGRVCEAISILFAIVEEQSADHAALCRLERSCQHGPVECR